MANGSRRTIRQPKYHQQNKSSQLSQATHYSVAKLAQLPVCNIFIFFFLVRHFFLDFVSIHLVHLDCPLFIRQSISAESHYGTCWTLDPSSLPDG